jgi:cytochrome d ubiquinol oxidase subunit I
MSLAMYLTLYAALLSAYVSVVFYLAKKAVNGGEEPLLNLKGLSHV